MKIALTSVTVNSPIEAFTVYTEVLGFVKRIRAAISSSLRRSDRPSTKGHSA